MQSWYCKSWHNLAFVLLCDMSKLSIICQRCSFVTVCSLLYLQGGLELCGLKAHSGSVDHNVAFILLGDRSGLNITCRRLSFVTVWSLGIAPEATPAATATTWPPLLRFAAYRTQKQRCLFQAYIRVHTLSLPIDYHNVCMLLVRPP